MPSELIPEPIQNCKICMRDYSTSSELILDKNSLENNQNLESAVININRKLYIM